jgi:hypothetical protein
MRRVVVDTAGSSAHLDCAAKQKHAILTQCPQRSLDAGTYNAPGVLSLGGYDTAFMAGDMQYISFDGSEGYYAVQFTGVGVNGVQLCSGEFIHLHCLTPSPTAYAWLVIRTRVHTCR